MIVSFRFALNDVDLDLTIDYQADDLFYNARNGKDNIDHIISRWHAIDEIHQINIVSKTPLIIKYINTNNGVIPICPRTADDVFASQEINSVAFNFTATIFHYESGWIAGWTIKKDVPDWVRELFGLHFAALKPQLIGTAQYVMPMLKDEAKANVTANARRRARVMLGNAQAILEFLGEVLE